METQIWSKSEEKWAYILVLRDQEVHCLKLTGNVFTLKGKVKTALEALSQGQAPAEVKAKAVETLDTRTISKAEVSPGNDALTLHGGQDGSKTLTYSTGEKNAEEILRAILAQSGRAFAPTKEEIGVIEALIPPVVIGAIGGFFCVGIYDDARKLAAGEDVEVTSIRRRGLRRLMITAAEMLGTNGSIAVGVALLLLIVGWAAKRIIHRPERTVWLPEAV